jgi:hypothetical protein
MLDELSAAGMLTQGGPGGPPAGPLGLAVV